VPCYNPRLILYYLLSWHCEDHLKHSTVLSNMRVYADNFAFLRHPLWPPNDQILSEKLDESFIIRTAVVTDEVLQKLKINPCFSLQKYRYFYQNSFYTYCIIFYVFRFVLRLLFAITDLLQNFSLEYCGL
jgi:hypothetical protein